MSIQTKWRGLKEILFFTNWLELIFSLTLFRKTELKIYRSRGYQFICDHGNGDENSIREAVVTPMYRDLLAKLNLSGPLSVIDLGANAGGFAALLLSDGYTLAKIWSVEMNPHTFHRLNFNINYNLSGIGRACNLAVAGTSGELSLKLKRGGTSCSILGAGQSEGEVSVIRSITFDDFWKEMEIGARVSLCKIDIEGAEYEMILGTHSTCLALCDSIIIEMHTISGCSMDELAAKIEGIGFEVMVRPQRPYASCTLWAFRRLR